MSLSGNNSALRQYTARQVVELALRRAGIPPAKFNSEILQVAADEFNLMLDEMLNLGMQLWGRDKIILPLYQNQNEVPCPLGTSVVISTNQRYLSRLDTNGWFSDNGGTAALAFDDNFDTACTQLTANGSIGAFFSAAAVTTVGVLFATSGTFDIFYEYTTDSGLTWTAIDSTSVTTGATNTWLWIDIEGVPNECNGFRVRSVSDVPISIAELYFGNNPTEIPLGVWNLDDWNAMVTKTAPGPPWNWYQQRDLDTPVLFVWPMPDATAKYYQLVCWRRRYLDQLSSMTQTLDVSRRWNEAMTASMARRLCLALPEVADMNRYGPLLQAEAAAVQLATGEERDPAPMRYNPGLDVYKA